MKEITERQKEILDFIASFIQDNRYSPCVRDISTHFGFSVKAAHDHLKALERKHMIKTTKGISRSIELTSDEFNPVEIIQIPVVGTIAAGKPLLSEENVEYNLEIPSTMLKGALDTYFALHVHGSSMIEDGIFDGDIAVLRKCDTADPGDIVAASVEDDDQGGITLKEYYPHPDHVVLHPANALMGPIITRACHIHGKMQLLIRQYKK